ncbi:MAG: amidohydrolase family protein, partial [Firmicutes bacterium]|nr:amidohydrolase family protein [Bacillota bacterium]
MIEGPRRDVEFRAGWDVLVLGDSIAYVGPRGGASAPWDCPSYDASGCVVMPGFINAHAHSAMSLLRAWANDLGLDDWLRTKIWPAEARMGREDVYWGAVLACAEMTRAGVTTFCDMYFHMDEVARAVSEAGLRA